MRLLFFQGRVLIWTLFMFYKNGRTRKVFVTRSGNCFDLWHLINFFKYSLSVLLSVGTDFRHYGHKERKKGKKYIFKTSGELCRLWTTEPWAYFKPYRSCSVHYCPIVVPTIFQPDDSMVFGLSGRKLLNHFNQIRSNLKFACYTI